MTSAQEKKCHVIIHTAAIGAGGGNLVPVPGVGIAADIVAMTAMAIASIKNTMLKQPIKTLTKELSKIVPFLGQVVAPTISITMVEAAGWSIAKELDRKFGN